MAGFVHSFRGGFGTGVFSRATDAAILPRLKDFQEGGGAARTRENDKQPSEVSGMHIFKRWSVAAAAALVAGSAWAVMDDPEQDPMVKEIIEERIAPVGSVTAVDKEKEAAAEEEEGPMKASEVYSEVCSSCHDNGAAGAPIMGEKDEWKPRADKGMDTLKDHAINGFKGMPPKGGEGSLSEDEVKAAIEYMLEETDISL